MKSTSKLTATCILLLSLIFTSCTSNQTTETTKTDSVEANIKMYTYTWDEIVNHGKLDMFNDSNFTTDVVMHTNPDRVGIDSARAYYANYLTGFSNIVFTIKDVFGQGNKLVKYWNFTGDNTGVFFGMPATGKHVSIDGVTLVRMQNGKIAEERDFLDNLDLMTQLGQIK
ncbi:MAG: ester cyclase [Parafilimonas sp.]